MTVTITNLNNELLSALEVLLKPFIKKGGVKIIKEMDEETAKLIKEYEDEKKQGKTKIYNTLEDYKRAMGCIS